MKIRVGLGYDIHRLSEGRPLYLGGVKIPFPKGLLGHSDGDCLIHALVDAILGAMGERDIGGLFPDSDPRFKDIESVKLLERTAGMLWERKGKILNADTLIIAQEPRLAEYIPGMKEALCPLLKVEGSALGIKPRTNEGLGEIGQGEAIAAWATVLLQLDGG